MQRVAEQIIQLVTKLIQTIQKLILIFTVNTIQSTLLNTQMQHEILARLT